MIQKNPHNLHNLIHIIHIIFIIQSAFNLLQPTSAKILVFSFAMFKFILQIYWNTCPQSVRNAFTMWLPLTHSCNMNKPTIDFHRLKPAQSATPLNTLLFRWIAQNANSGQSTFVMATKNYSLCCGNSGF